MSEDLDTRLREILLPLANELEALQTQRQALLDKAQELSLDIQKIIKIMQAANDAPTPTRKKRQTRPLGEGPTKVSAQNIERTYLMIQENVKDEEQVFTLNDVQSWADLSHSTAGEVVRILRHREKVRLIGRITKPGARGLTPYGYQLMP
ncbi:MAG TPA: hypothetical protein VH593_26600 [Ktedonobacteraceae bacterium]|jgi:hypothetical protein